MLQMYSKTIYASCRLFSDSGRKMFDLPANEYQVTALVIEAGFTCVNMNPDDTNYRSIE
ncbi:MAG TPA: hypothetical protein VL943_05230 [Niabella sp.]|nr:hypothetical protein [Niabella sp.]